MTVALGDARTSKKTRIYAIGDLHGCLSEYTEMLALIEQHLKANPIKNHRIIFLGDYVDRGPDSKKLIKSLIKLQASNPDVTCLIGNHDEKLLLATEPFEEEAFAKYLRYGGCETLQSYGFPADELELFRTQDFSTKKAKQFASQVRKHVSKSHLKFLKNLSTSTTNGDYFFCHAGVRPTIKFTRQSRHDLMWIREPFLSWKKPLEKVVIHGHTRQAKPDICNNRINVDTSCCYGQELTAVVLEGKSHSFLKVPAHHIYWKR